MTGAYGWALSVRYLVSVTHQAWLWKNNIITISYNKFGYLNKLKNSSFIFYSHIFILERLFWRKGVLWLQGNLSEKGRAEYPSNCKDEILVLFGKNTFKKTNKCFVNMLITLLHNVMSMRQEKWATLKTKPKLLADTSNPVRII